MATVGSTPIRTHGEWGARYRDALEERRGTSTNALEEWLFPQGSLTPCGPERGVDRRKVPGPYDTQSVLCTF